MNSSKSSENQSLDLSKLQQLQEITGGDPDFLVELIDVYLEDAPRLFATMKDALSRDDAESTIRAAHDLKSNSLNLGATALGAVCLEMETRAKDEKLQEAALLLPVAEAEYFRVVAALRAVSVK